MQAAKIRLREADQNLLGFQMRPFGPATDDVVNQAAHLANLGGKGATAWNGGSPRIHMDGVFQQNLNDHNQGLTRRVSSWPREVYSSDAVNTAMSDWLQAQS